MTPPSGSRKRIGRNRLQLPSGLPLGRADVAGSRRENAGSDRKTNHRPQVNGPVVIHPIREVEVKENFSLMCSTASTAERFQRRPGRAKSGWWIQARERFGSRNGAGGAGVRARAGVRFPYGAVGGGKAPGPDSTYLFRPLLIFMEGSCTL